MKVRSIYLLLFTITFVACGSDSFTPKPRGYPRVHYPEKSYRPFEKDYCNFTFDLPSYTKIVKDTTFFNEIPANDCWFDIYYPMYDCRIHCTYNQIGKAKTFTELKEDAFEMVDYHNKRANYIEEIPIRNQQSVSGFAFEIEGPAASPFQFYLTDTTKNWFRASVYFNTKARPDSLAPIFNFVRKDIENLIDTFKWLDAAP